ncbi:hypothetical protein [Streptomyces niveus]|uniref:hypothetical protein n=1 Tax=Streptomyces niveus TaxID=193462 RepID=UPI0003C5D13E|nr:hypothetical protein [Streptomyces niveus]EST17897.1 hypothetical protein M877_40015 [Streptomyces niveus NCIMB 11891]
MYGSARIELVDRAVYAAGRLARVARLALRLATRTRLTPTDLYAAVATAKFMAAHELVDQAADEIEASADPDVDLTQIRQPSWFGSTTIFEEK